MFICGKKLTVKYRGHIISRVQTANRIFSWIPSSVFGFPWSDGCRNESVFCCALTGNTLPNCWLFRGRDAVNAWFRSCWLCLRVRFDVNRAFPEWKPRGRFVRWTLARSAAPSERQRVADASFAVRCPTLSVSSAQVQRRCSERLVVTVHGHGPGNEEAGSPGASGIWRRSVTVQWDHPNCSVLRNRHLI